MINAMMEQPEIDKRWEFQKQLFDEFTKSDYYDPFAKGYERDLARFLADKIYDLENK